MAAIQSAQAQTHRNCEVIVVDDGFQDGSGELVEEFVKGKNTAIEIRYVRQANQGSSVARNAGIENTTEDYITFLDSDDLLRAMY